MKICVGNWKMNGSIETVKMLSEKLNKERFPETEVVIAVPYTLLTEARKSFNRSYKIAAQCICPYAQEGAYTGGISAQQVKNAQAEIVIIGHSERTKYFHETNEQVRQQLTIALEAGLAVILCVGETELERKENRTVETVQKRLDILKPLVKKKDSRVIVAYEPIWAIGTGTVPSNQEIEEVVESIHREMKESIGGVLYGGSVNKNSAQTLLGIPRLSGFLVGNASLTDEFIEICKLFK